MAEHRRILFIGAHFDDEVFILLQLKQHIDAGDHVSWVWITVPEQRIQRIKRTHEHRIAMKFLHVKREDIHLFKFPDRKTFYYIREIYDQLKKLILKINPDIIYMPAFEGGNIDHDIVHFVIVTICRIYHLHPELYEFSLYNLSDSSLPFIPFNMGGFIPSHAKSNYLELKPEQKSFIKRYFSLYKSQYGKTQLYLQLLKNKDAIIGHEAFRKVPNYDYTVKPSNRIAYETYQVATFKDFLEATTFLLLDLGFKRKEKEYEELLRKYDKRFGDKKNGIHIFLNKMASKALHLSIS